MKPAGAVRDPGTARTVAEVLAAAAEDMSMDEACLRYLRGEPTGLRHPRRKLLRWLAGRH